MQILKQSTAVDVIIGPFVDNTDGDTEETALTINAADVKLSKNGQTLAGKSDVTACAHDANGMYNCELDSTDTNTVGTMVIFVHVSGALAVRHELQVVEEVVYDALYGASATGPLQSTTSGRKLDVTAAGTAGINWGNIENAGTTVDLSATSINLCDTITTYTGNTVQTGDSFARLGAPSGASVSADIATAQTDLDTITGADGAALATVQGAITWDAQTISVTGATANFTLAGSGTGDSLAFTRAGSGNLFDAAWAADVESEVNDALVATGLDHLFSASITGTDVTDNSFAALLTSNSATADFDDYDNLTDSLPAVADGLSSVANVGSAIHKQAASYVLTTGTQSANTYTATEALDSVKHEHTDAAGVMELYYEFLIGSGTPTSVQVTGLINGSNDSIGVYGYDWTVAGWVQIGTLSGQNDSAINQVNSYDLFVGMVGTGTDEGKVRIRFYEASGLTSATLRIDQIFVAFSQGSEGYDNGAIWIDTSFSNAGTEVGIDGVARNPVSTIAAANTLEGLTNLHRFYIAPESVLTFAASQQDQSFSGDEWTLALGGQDISGTKIAGASRGVSGTCTGAISPFFSSCSIGTVTAPPSAFDKCGFTSTLTLGSAGDFFLIDCFSQVAGAASPTIDMGAAVGATNVSIRRWAGGITINNLAAGDVVSLDGVFGTINLNGADAQVEIRGIAKAVANNLTGSPTVNDKTVKADDISAVLADTNELQGDWTDGGRLDLILDDILTDTGTTLAGQLTTIDSAVDSIKEVTDLGVRGAAIAGTLSTTEMTTDLTETTNSHYIGRLLTFTSGALNKQQTDITDYTGSTKVLTFTALTEAPSNGDTFIIT